MPQAPAVQVVPAEQAVPHAPQLALSVWTLMQPEAQAALPAWQQSEPAVGGVATGVHPAVSFHHGPAQRAVERATA